MTQIWLFRYEGKATDGGTTFVNYFFCLTVLPLLNLNAAMQDMMFGAVAAILQP